MITNIQKKKETSSSLGERFLVVRKDTEKLLSKLSPEDACVQSMPDASPAKWHSAHTSWFFETFILKKYEKNFSPFDETYETLFNSYYNSIGQQFARPSRGLITRPGNSIIESYRHDVSERILNIIENHTDPDLLKLLELGLNHEQQHQELLLMDIKHLLSINPTYPAFCSERIHPSPAVESLWLTIEGGLFSFGQYGSEFHFDNEGPAHKRYLESYQIASQLISNGEYLAFIEDGGYDNPLLWLSDGWSWVERGKSNHPLYWTKKDSSWFEFTLFGLLPLNLENPVCHINFYEASAYANWAQVRLPTEFEWEFAAVGHQIPVAPIRFHATKKEEGNKLNDLHGSAWQWTNSGYLPYPRFSPRSGAIGEYNGKFMSNQNVVRGSACCTPPNHSRHTYRNFFYPHQRWAFTGVRVARDNH